MRKLTSTTQATGCGKTHTISGSQSQPGIVFLIMKDLFARIAARSGDTDFSLTVSYLEIYNETIRDLLAPESGPLALRESSNGAAAPAGLSTKEPTCATDVVEWITLGNQNRTVNATEANATSSRSHAVLTVTVAQRAKGGGLTDSHSTACLSVIDLAGSERASVTKNKGDRLIEGANINRSLLALGNCINALCDPRKRGHVPYRDSKLTRLLKQSLGGNCMTVMIVCVSPSSAHYDETHNTLQYANRAKEIKTKAVRNIISVDRHVAQYCQQILEQGQQIDLLKAQLAKQQALSSVHDREEDVKVAALGRQKLLSAWEAGRDRLVQSERARVEKHVITSVVDILQRWRASAFTFFENCSPSSTTAASSTVALIKNGYESLLQSLSRSAAQLGRDAEAGHDALSIYSALFNNLTTTMKSTRPGASPLFDLESRLLDARLESAMAEAREAGLVEGMKVQARAMHAMSLARAQVGTTLDAARDTLIVGEDAGSEKALRRLAEGMDTANSEALLAMFNPQSLAGVAPFSSSTASKTAVKRDQGSRSPFEPQSLWAKAPRAAISGMGSAPTGPLSSPLRPLAPAPAFRKSSPKKGVSFTSSPRKPRKEVQWRDETGDGQQLEDVKWQSPGMGTPESTLPAEPPVDTGSTQLSKDIPTLSGLWPSSSTTALPTAAGMAAEQMAANLKQRTTVTSMLRNKGSSSRISPLVPLAEDGRVFSFHQEPHRFPAVPSSSSFSSRPIFSDLANTSTSSAGNSPPGSFSMAGPAGLYAPLVPSKPTPAILEPDTPRRAAQAGRVSNIGPLRSAKPNRRTSFIAPPTPASGSLKSRASGVGFSASFAPPSARKSPRKVTTSRRPSSTVGGAIGGEISSLMGPAPTFLGSKSAARIAARRESMMAALAETSATKRASPGVNGIPPLPKMGIWR